MLNRVVLIGRLTHDPELRYTPNTGTAIARFTLAVDRPFVSTRKEKETDFIRIVCWGKLAERCKEHLGKGRLVAVDGKLQIRNWEGNDGQRRNAVEVRADEVRFLDKAHAKPEGGGDAAPEERKNYGDIPDSEIDEEIDLSEEPF